MSERDTRAEILFFSITPDAWAAVIEHMHLIPHGQIRPTFDKFTAGAKGHYSDPWLHIEEQAKEILELREQLATPDVLGNDERRKLSGEVETDEQEI
jgi:hypothetical protein